MLGSQVWELRGVDLREILDLLFGKKKKFNLLKIASFVAVKV